MKEFLPYFLGFLIFVLLLFWILSAKSDKKIVHEKLKESAYKNSVGVEQYNDYTWRDERTQEFSNIFPSKDSENTPIETQSYMHRGEVLRILCNTPQRAKDINGYEIPGIEKLDDPWRDEYDT